MLRNLTTLLILLSGFGLLHAQQPVVTIQGTLVSILDSTPIPQAHITSFGSQVITTTDEDGRFTLQVAANDTLIVSTIQYQQEFVAVSGIQQPTDYVLYLAPVTYQLGEITINEFSKDRFRRAFMELKLPPDKYAVDMKIPDNFDWSYVPANETKVPAPNNPNGQMGGITIATVSFGKDKFQKVKEKQELAIAQWQTEDQRRENIRKKFSGAVVQRIVPITDEQLEDFLKFCKLNDVFIEEASDYHIAAAIKDCYLAFVDTDGTH